MARIKLESISKIEKERNTVHDEVTATYTVFYAGQEKYLQIDTYGKDGRAIPGKISQSFQFDKESARYLVELFAKEFDLTFRIK